MSSCQFDSSGKSKLFEAIHMVSEVLEKSLEFYLENLCKAQCII